MSSCMARLSRPQARTGVVTAALALIIASGALLSGCGPSEELDPSGYSVPVDAQYGQVTMTPTPSAVTTPAATPSPTPGSPSSPSSPGETP